MDDVRFCTPEKSARFRLGAQRNNMCELCKQERELTFHHLIPRTLHTNKWFKKRHTKEHMRTHGINVCEPCHSGIHKIHNNKHLAKELNTLELLLADDKIQKHIKWSAKQKLP